MLTLIETMLCGKMSLGMPVHNGRPMIRNELQTSSKNGKAVQCGYLNNADLYILATLLSIELKYSLKVKGVKKFFGTLFWIQI